MLEKKSKMSQKILESRAMFKIEKGIRMPEPPTEGRRTKYPWAVLEVGDSFEIDTPLQVARTNARQASARYGKMFDAQPYKGKVRIWRWR
jgi:hypothetical protein